MSDNATVTTQEPTAGGQDRTFTQEEVNAIVGRRLAEERGKYADYDTLKEKAEKYDAAEEAAKTELQKATERADTLQTELDQMKQADAVRKVRDKISQETGVPAGLLSGVTEEECTEQARNILAFAKPGYPKVKDAGEVKPTGGGKTRDQFKDWFEASLSH